MLSDAETLTMKQLFSLSFPGLESEGLRTQVRILEDTNLRVQFVSLSFKKVNSTRQSISPGVCRIMMFLYTHTVGKRHKLKDVRNRKENLAKKCSFTAARHQRADAST